MTKQYIFWPRKAQRMCTAHMPNAQSEFTFNIQHASHSQCIAMQSNCANCGTNLYIFFFWGRCNRTMHFSDACIILCVFCYCFFLLRLHFACWKFVVAFVSFCSVRQWKSKRDERVNIFLRCIPIYRLFSIRIFFDIINVLVGNRHTCCCDHHHCRASWCFALL